MFLIHQYFVGGAQSRIHRTAYTRRRADRFAGFERFPVRKIREKGRYFPILRQEGRGIQSIYF